LLTIFEIHSAKREVHYGRILLFHKVIFCESTIMKNHVRREALTLEPLELSSSFLPERIDQKIYLLTVVIYTCVVVPSYLANTVAKLTWGIIFFSTESWNKGGGGRSTERNKKGDVTICDSVKRW